MIVLLLQSSQFSKLEKADILELTVRHLRALHRQQVADTINQEPAVTGKYQAGFSECAKEVMRFIGSVTEVNTDVKSRVMDHLNLCLHVVNCSPAASSEDVADQRLTQRPVHTSQQDTDVRNLLPSSVTKAVPSVVCVTSVRSASTLNGGISDIGINDILPSISTTALRLSSMPSPFSNNFKASCPDFKLFPVQSKQQPSSVSMSTRTTLTPTLHILSNSENRTGTVALFLNGTDTNRSLSAISDMSSVDDSKTNINAIPMYTFSSAVLSTDGDKVNNSHNYPVSMDSCSCMPMHDFHQLVHNSPSSLHLGAQCQDFCTGNVSTSESFVSVPVDLSPPYKAKCNSRQFLSSPVTEIYQPWRPW